jgi:predicted alpha/beta-fold hydrolase
MRRIYDKLSKKGAIWERSVIPSLFVGTRGVASSVAAYALRHREENETTTRRIREILCMGADGAKLVLDWEVPITALDTVKVGKVACISLPVVLLVHGMNNDSSFGYIRSMMKTATNRGWIAVCMNLRGQDWLGEVKNTTPRGVSACIALYYCKFHFPTVSPFDKSYQKYNAGFTGDLRGVIIQLEKRLAKNKFTNSYIGGPIYLVGYSLGANIITKYLGEESLYGTLPKCIGGGAALGNPLHIASNTVPFPWNMILAMGVKRSLLQNFSVYMQHHEQGFRSAMKKAMTSQTIGQLDDAVAPYILRNEPYPPFASKVGYRDGNEYWKDSSSHRYVGHVSVPLLKVAASDDFLVFG